MSLVFAYRPSARARAGGFERFEATLEAERSFYQDLFGRPLALALRRAGPIVLGQIAFDLGVAGWRPAAETDGMGLFWAGLCEEFLEWSPDDTAVRVVVDRSERDPRAIAEWDGRFALFTWNAGAQRVVVTPGAVECPSLWHAEGPDGWAIGSRAAPLLTMIGRRAELDLDAASAFADFEYLVGGPLFAGVERLRPRRRVVLEGERAPSIRTYVSLSDLLAQADTPRLWKDRVACGAERLTKRIERQLRHSPSPILLLTGGYDSRCIAAAALRAGYRGAAYTSGARDSDDVVKAAGVVDRLGLRHRISHGHPTRSLESLTGSPARLADWARWTEGVDVLRQALPYRGFFLGHRPFPASKVQLLHGFAGGLLRGNRYLEFEGAFEATTMERLTAILRKRTSRTLELLRSTDEAAQRALGEIAEEAPIGQVTVAQWITLYTWQNKMLRWGTDMFSARDLIDWHWTPYMDRVLLRLTWDQTNEERLSHRFLVDLATELAPALAGVPYLAHGPHGGRPLGLFGRIQHGRRVAAHRRVWDAILLSGPARIWDRIVSPDELQRLYEREPMGEPLWCLATAELTARAFEAAPAPPRDLVTVGA